MVASKIFIATFLSLPLFLVCSKFIVLPVKRIQMTEEKQ